MKFKLILNWLVVLGLVSAVTAVPTNAQSRTEKERNQTTAVDKGYPGRDADLEKAGAQQPVESNTGSNTVTSNQAAPVKSNSKSTSNSKSNSNKKAGHSAKSK